MIEYNVPIPSIGRTHLLLSEGNSDVDAEATLIDGGKVIMKTQNSGNKGSSGAAAWLWLSIAAALLATAGSIIALGVKSIYAG